ncbi:MAG: DUF3857 domain-containing protein [Deltaproteobacteria bacterium]|nr:DUF3857 domain-containing protein [Deltaproteobacteria bacterium]
MSRSTLPACMSILLAALLWPTSARSSDGFIVTRQLTVIIGHDGITKQRVRVETKLDSLFATNALADPRIRFDRSSQELGILKAATVLPDGTVLDAPSRALNTAAPDAVAGCPDFSRIAEVVVSFVGIEPGVVTILEYEIVDKAPRQGPYEYLAELASELPTRQLTVTVRVPARERFDSLLLGDSGRVVAVEPVLERADSVFTWTATDLPALSSPPGFPLPDDRPRLLFSTSQAGPAAISPQAPAPTHGAGPTAGELRSDPQAGPVFILPRAPAPTDGAGRTAGELRSDPQAGPVSILPQAPAPTHGALSSGNRASETSSANSRSSLDRLLSAADPGPGETAGDATRLVQAFTRLSALLRIMPVPLLPDSFPEPRALETVAASRQATPLEAAWLAVHLADRLSAESRIVLALPGPAPRSPGKIQGPEGLSRVARVWVEIKTASGPLWLSADRMELLPVLEEPPSMVVLVVDPGRRSKVVQASSLSGSPAASVRFSAQAEGNATELTLRFSLSAGGAASPFVRLAANAAPDAAKALASGLLGPGFTLVEVAVTASSTDSFEMSGRAVSKTPASAFLPGAPGIELLRPYLVPARPGPSPLPGPLVYEQSVRLALAGLTPVLPFARAEDVPGCRLSTALSGDAAPGFDRSFTLDSQTAAGRTPAPLKRFLDASRIPVLFLPATAD